MLLVENFGRVGANGNKGEAMLFRFARDHHDEFAGDTATAKFGLDFRMRNDPAVAVDLVLA